MRKIFIIIGLFALSACDHLAEDSKAVKEQAKTDAKTVQDNVTGKTMRVADNVRDSVKRTNERMRSWWLTPLPSQEKLATPTRYCYKVLQDILCYREQMVGWENKLVGYQGTNARTPNPATMQILDVQPETTENLPVNKVVNAKPVFVAPPADTKESESQNSQQINTDAEHEAFPSSPLAPQL